MWTYEQIITEADERYPNALSTASKLRKIHNRDRELLRTIYRKKTATVMDIVADQALYPLDFHPSKIIRVVWDGTSIDYEDINDTEAQGNEFLYTYENSLGRYPTPETGVSRGIFIFHYIEPTEPVEDNVATTYPSFDPDFPMVHVYGLVLDMAEAARDKEALSYFRGLYSAILEDFKKANPEPELPPMRVE